MNELTEDVQSPPTKSSPSVFDLGARLTAAGLWGDRFFLIIACILLGFPHLLRGNELSTLNFWGIVLSTFEILLESTVLYLVAVHLLQRFSERAVPFAKERYKRLVLFAFLGRLVLFIPLLPLQLSGEETGQLQALWLVLGLAALACTYAFFFYFVPIVLGVSSPREILTSSYRYLSFSRTLPVRVLFFPWVLFLLVVGATSALDPQFLSTTSQLFVAFGYGVQKVVMIYLALGCGLAAAHYAEDIPLHIHSEDPLRSTNVPSKESRWFAPDWLVATLSNRVSGFLLAGSLMLLAIGTARLQALPFEGTLSTLSTQVEDKLIKTSVAISVESGKQATFSPIFFSLRTKKGAVVSETPQVVYLDGNDKEVSLGTPLTLTEETRFIIHFPTDRTVEQTTKLRDLFLWYQGKALQEIKVKPSNNEEEKTL